MKKLFSLLVILCLVCALVPAMADISASSMAGNWSLKLLGNGEIALDVSSQNIVMNLTADGNGEMTTGGNPDGTCAWKVVDGSLLIYLDGDPAEGTLLTEGILMVVGGNYTFIFLKE